MIFNDKKRFIAGVVLVATPLALFAASSVGAGRTVNFVSDLLVWIILFHTVGLGIAAISASRDINKTFLYEYFLLYPATLFASSSVLFLLVANVLPESNIKYFIAASISLYLGLNIDHLSGWILRK